MGRVVRRPILALVVLSAVLGACAPGAEATPTPAASISSNPLSIWNGTSIQVSLVVNGTVVETVAPGAYQDPIPVALPALPWSIETRSPGGRLLSKMTVGSTTTGHAVRVDLSCGRLDVWSGAPLVGGTFIPGPSGDCG